MTVVPDATEPAGRVPRVWILLSKGAGGNAQMFNLAEALGWPYEKKRVIYNRLERLPNLLLCASALSVDRRRSDALEPPWPDLVIAASRRSAPVALWIRRQSGGQTRLVHLIHTMAPLDRFDLIVTTPQCCLPERPNILHNVGPLNTPDDDRLRAAAEQWAPRLRALPRPFVALMVGGNSSSYELDGETAARLGREASALVRARGGSLLVSTSPRTPAAAAEALCRAIDVPSHVYRWRRDDPDNPYTAFLALADAFIVTVDSASQLVEACAAGKPVHLFDWPMRPRVRTGYKGFLRRCREQARRRPGTPVARLYDLLLDLGLIKPPRDFAAFHAALAQRGLLARLGVDGPAVPARPLDDLERAVHRVRALFES